jgi:hypothetical protein
MLWPIVSGADEGVCGHIGDGFFRAVGHPGADKQQVKCGLGQPVVQCCGFLGNRDVDDFHD